MRSNAPKVGDLIRRFLGDVEERREDEEGTLGVEEKDGAASLGLPVEMSCSGGSRICQSLLPDPWGEKSYQQQGGREDHSLPPRSHPAIWQPGA